MEPKHLTDLFGLAEKWKKVLEALMPESIVEIGDIKTKILFTWFFENKLSNGFNQKIKMVFYLNGTVSVQTQSGSELQELKSFEAAEKWLINYLELPKMTVEPSALLQTLPSLSERKKLYKRWTKLLDKLKPYGVEVDTDSEYRPFSLYLPTLESVLANTGEYQYQDEGTHLDPGEDWAKVIAEEVIVPLKKLYAFSATEIPDFTEELKLLQLDQKHEKLYSNLENWITWLQELSEKLPFKMYTRDIWAALSREKCHFDGEKIVEGVSSTAGHKNGIIVVDFYHDYLFNGNQSSIRGFSGKLYLFTDNVAALEFSGTSLWGMRFREQKFHLHGPFAGGLGEHREAQEIKSMFLTSTWSEIGVKFNELTQTIVALLGEGIEILPKVVEHMTEKV